MCFVCGFVFVFCLFVCFVVCFCFCFFVFPVACFSFRSCIAESPLSTCVGAELKNHYNQLFPRISLKNRHSRLH